MKVRGERECKDCGTRWSYYDTGSVTCPECGSLRSVGVDSERTRHTDTPVDLDLDPVREALADGELSIVVGDLKSALRSYTRRRGFINAGDLEPLDEAFLVANELLHAADIYDRTRDPTDDDRLYVLRLIRGLDVDDRSAPDRPAPDEVPAAMTPARGLGYANAIDDYRDEVATYLGDRPDPDVRRLLGAVRDRVRRIEALQGDVDPEEVETLVRAVRDVRTYLAEDDESALARAESRLADLTER